MQAASLLLAVQNGRHFTLKIGDGRNLRYDLCEYERRLRDAASEVMSQFRPLTNAVPINTRFAEPDVKYVLNSSGLRYSFRPGAALPDGEPIAFEEWQSDDVSAIF